MCIHYEISWYQSPLVTSLQSIATSFQLFYDPGTHPRFSPNLGKKLPFNQSALCLKVFKGTRYYNSKLELARTLQISQPFVSQREKMWHWRRSSSLGPTARELCLLWSCPAVLLTRVHMRVFAHTQQVRKGHLRTAKARNVPSCREKVSISSSWWGNWAGT